jgi:peptidoglycan hydrolase CwlO-like protein
MAYDPSQPPGAVPSYRQKRGPLTPILAVATVILLIAAVTMTALFVVKNNDLGDTRTKLSASERTASRQAKELKSDGETISGLQSDLSDTKEQLDATKQELTGTKNQLGSTQAEKAVVSRCLNLVLQFIQAVNAGDAAKAKSLSAQANSPCQAADRIING